MTPVLAAPPITSLGRPLPRGEAALGFVEPSNHLLEDPAALSERLEAEGYLFFKRFLDPDLVLAARRTLLEKLDREHLLDRSRPLMDGVVNPDLLEDQPAAGQGALPLRLLKTGRFRPDLAMADATIERVTYGPELCGFYDRLFGQASRHFDFTWLRVMGPGPGTSAHCDWVYMSRGSRRLLTCWIPYGEVPLEVGGLILLERSHLQADRIRNYLDKDVDAYCENRPEEVRKVRDAGGWSIPGWLSQRPDTLPSRFRARWLTCPCWEPGDFITFPMHLIHGSLDNRSDRFRISTDVRYQPASDPIDTRWIGANPPGHGKAGKRGRIC